MFLFNNNKSSKKSIKVNQITNLLNDIDLIDIREPYEYSYGHIPKAKNIPMNTILSNPGKYLDKNKEYYIVCHSGSRSSSACNVLSKQGYKVINVSGGTGSYRGKLDI